MSHATATAAVGKPWSPDSDAAASMMANARAAAAAPAAENEEGPIRSTFFRHLDMYSYEGGSDCQSWRIGRFENVATAVRMARVDRAIAGIEGVLAVIHAADLAAAEGEQEPTVNSYLRDRLMFGARELTEVARAAIEDLRDQARREA